MRACVLRVFAVAVAASATVAWGTPVLVDTNANTGAYLSPPIVNDGGMWPSLIELNGGPAIAHHEDWNSDLGFVGAASFTGAPERESL